MKLVAKKLIRTTAPMDCDSAASKMKHKEKLERF
jgi:hypothetical protein